MLTGPFLSPDTTRNAGPQRRSDNELTEDKVVGAWEFSPSSTTLNRGDKLIARNTGGEPGGAAGTLTPGKNMFECLIPWMRTGGDRRELTRGRNSRLLRGLLSPGSGEATFKGATARGRWIYLTGRLRRAIRTIDSVTSIRAPRGLRSHKASNRARPPDGKRGRGVLSMPMYARS